MIYNNEKAYAFLVRYYLDKLSDPYFERELENKKNQRWFLCVNMASWIPYDIHYAELVQKIKISRPNHHGKKCSFIPVRKVCGLATLKIKIAAVTPRFRCGIPPIGEGAWPHIFRFFLRRVG